MKVTYMVEDPYEGKNTIEYPSIPEFLQAHPIYSSLLDKERAKIPCKIDIEVQTLPMHILITVETEDS